MIPRNLAPAARYIIAIPRQFATPALFNTANDEFAGRFSADEKFPNNERRTSNESDKDSIVDYTCNLSLRRDAGNNVRYCNAAQFSVSALSNDGQFVHRVFYLNVQLIII